MMIGLPRKHARVVGFLVLVFGAVLWGGLAPLLAAGVTFDQLNQKQGFNFQRDVQDPIGFVTSLKIGSEVIKADLKLRNPETLKAGRSELPNNVGVLGKIVWGGGYGDPIEFTCQISTYNKQKISQLLHKTLQNIECEFGFMVYDYDPMKKAYFPAFYPETAPLKALLYKEGGKNLQCKIEGKGDEVTSPENWTLSIKVAPQALKQSLGYAVAKDKKLLKQWGMAVTAEDKKR